jgi:hypothetical protein
MGRVHERTRIAVIVAAIAVAVLAVVAVLRSCDANRVVFRRQETRMALGRFQAYLTSYLNRHHSLPGPTLRDAIDALEAEGTKYNESDGIRITGDGKTGRENGGTGKRDITE